MELMRCNLIEIIIRTMRKISRKEAGDINDLSRYILDYVSENYMNPVSLTDIGSRLNYSLPYICKRFSGGTGISFSACLQKKRIEQSCRLIANTDKKLGEIAGLVGYHDLKFFNRVFKKHLNMTPHRFQA